MNMSLDQCRAEVSELKSKLVECDKRRLLTKEELESAREELEASRDREMHLKHDLERLETNIVSNFSCSILHSVHLPTTTPLPPGRAARRSNTKFEPKK